MGKKKVTGSNLLTSLVKALTVLDELVLGESAADGVTLGVLSDKLEMPSNTVHKILRTLCECGYARQHERGRYGFGRKVEQIRRGEQVLDNEALEKVIGLLQKFTGKYGEACACSVLQQDRRLVVARVDARHAVQIPESFMEDNPYYSRASVRVMMAYTSAENLAYILEMHGMPLEQWDGIDTLAKLELRLKRIRQGGYALVAEQEMDVVAGAVAVFDRSGTFWGVVGSYAPAYRVKGSNRKDWMAGLIGLGKQLSGLLPH